jgi:hypothetical protein
MSMKLIMGLALATMASTPLLAAEERSALFSINAEAQSLGKRLKGIGRRIANEVEDSVDQKAREVTRCAFDDQKCIRDAQRRGDDVQLEQAKPMEAGGTTYRNVTFPQGDISFADEVVSFRPGTPNPTEPHLGAQNALGVPDWLAGKNNCRTQSECSFVSLGSGGELVVRFTDNVLTGSGDSEIDLWIMEVGPDVEDMTVDISTDGVNWRSVGAIGGGKSGVDIDAYGFGPETAFTYVRLTDDPNKGGRTGPTAGADVDAIGAISTRAGTTTGCTCP